MQQKLRDFMTSEHLKSGQLAEALGINPAGISHILAGRNKPGFDLLQKILRRFPRLNPDWLLLDEGPMYREGMTAEPSTAEHTTPSVVDAPATPTSNASLFAQTATTQETARPVADSSVQQAVGALASHSASRVARIVIFYDDHTFESFTPNK